MTHDDRVNDEQRARAKLWHQAEVLLSHGWPNAAQRLRGYLDALPYLDEQAAIDAGQEVEAQVAWASRETCERAGTLLVRREPRDTGEWDVT